MRKPIVSRSMKVTFVKVKAYNLKNDEPCTIDQEIPRAYKDDTALNKAVKNFIENDEIKVLKILESEERTKLYAMSEATFIANAMEITGRSAAETAALFGTTPEELEVESTDEE